tara:strand:- start:943 stop:1170 length:228 start_codon:yes stop_codon:yes gene_type:complete
MNSWHAFFSQEQKTIRITHKNVTGYTNIYLTTDGREVEVTEVCKQKDSYNKEGFPDFVYLGQVTKWVRTQCPDSF